MKEIAEKVNNAFLNAKKSSDSKNQDDLVMGLIESARPKRTYWSRFLRFIFKGKLNKSDKAEDYVFNLGDYVVKDWMVVTENEREYIDILRCAWIKLQNEAGFSFCCFQWWRCLS